MFAVSVSREFRRLGRTGAFRHSVIFADVERASPADLECADDIDERQDRGGQMARDIGRAGDPAPDEYVQRLSKIIPAEITAGYVAITSLLAPLHRNGDFYLLCAFAVLLVVLPFYMKFVLGMKDNVQIVVSTLSFPIWAANISNIPLSEDLHRFGYDVSPLVFGVALILWTIATPIAVR